MDNYTKISDTKAQYVPQASPVELDANKIQLENKTLKATIQNHLDIANRLQATYDHNCAVLAALSQVGVEPSNPDDSNQ